MNNERESIQACIRGDRNAQRKLYECHSPKMFAVCLRYSRNREEAEEALQEGFIQVFKGIETFKHEGSFEGWIRKIMVCSCVKIYRSASKLYLVNNFESQESEQVDIEETLSRIDTKELLRMVQELPAACRLVFNLYVFEGFKHREISKLISISIGTSKSNLFDAKRILKHSLSIEYKVAAK